ncbi:MAG: divergent polysaccharide deacetylase family protein [Treponema sp.]|nr:divergent polysaccharide deacetylase family protein [Treponema sp.]
MAVKNTSSKKKTTSSTRKKTGTRSRKKAKVYVSPYKAMLLCAAVVLFCLCLLLIVSKLDSSKTADSSSLPAITERFEEKQDNKTSVSTTTQETEKKQENIKNKEVIPVPNDSNAKKDSEQIVKTPDPVPIVRKEEVKTVETKKEEVIPVPVVTKTETSGKKVEETKPAITKTSYGFPAAVNHAQLIFVFDDGGQNLSHLNAFLKLPFPVTIAVLPRLTYSVESAKRIRASGMELMLHQPMQAVNKSVNPGPGAITPEMDEDEIISTLFTNITEIGPIAGINNHEGSAITADAEKMAVILKTTSENGIFFLDSRTNVETKVPYVAGEMGYGYYERNIFLDNTKTRENALTELKKGLTIANKNGSVIMIGHVWSADFLPAFLQDVYPELKEKGYTFSVVSKSNALKY